MFWIHEFTVSGGTLVLFYKLLLTVRTASAVKVYSYLSSFLRWHHIESLLNGGVTITVNFWYKVCIFVILTLYPHLCCLATTCFFIFTHLFFLWLIRSGCLHTQEDRVPAACSSEGGHHEKYWENAGRSTRRPTWGKITYFVIPFRIQTLS